MGGISKGLIPFKNKPMIQWISETLKPQVDCVIINAPESEKDYTVFADHVVEDKLPGYQGPLAGIHAAMSETKHPFIAVVPCDSPLIPDDLIARLGEPLRDKSIDLAVVVIDSRPHPVFFITKSNLKDSLGSFLKSGGRKIDLWFSKLNVAEVDFSDKPKSFLNFNTIRELKAVENNSITD